MFKKLIFVLLCYNCVVFAESVKKQEKYCILIDGYKWSKYFVDTFSKLDCKPIYIQSTKEPLARFIKSTTYNERDFIATYSYNGDITELLKALGNYKPISAVITGLESGINLADLLSERLATPTNGTVKSQARTDKFQMAQALSASGLKTAKYFKSNDCNKIIIWIKNNTTYPVVLKPLESGGTDGVFICMDDTEVRKAFKNILSSPKSLFGKKNIEVLVQSYLHGTEYIVNTVSCNGFHYVTDIWEYKKRLINGKPIYDRELLLSSNGQIQSMLIPYVFNVLDALDIKYGAAHHEVS